LLEESKGVYDVYIKIHNIENMTEHIKQRNASFYVAPKPDLLELVKANLNVFTPGFTGSP
jgi:hypothetical protein